MSSIATVFQSSLYALLLRGNSSLHRCFICIWDWAGSSGRPDRAGLRVPPPLSCPRRPYVARSPFIGLRSAHRCLRRTAIEWTATRESSSRRRYAPEQRLMRSIARSGRTLMREIGTCACVKSALTRKSHVNLQ
jgi:hypothetical protein